jgi:hypothetical protein
MDLKISGENMKILVAICSAIKSSPFLSTKEKDKLIDETIMNYAVEDEN